MRDWISKKDIRDFILSKNPNFYKYNLGDKVVYRSYSGEVKEGVIEELLIDVSSSFDIKPEYKVRYNDKEFGTDWVRETEFGQWISNKKKDIKKYRSILKKLEINKEERRELFKELDEIGVEFQKKD